MAASTSDVSQTLKEALYETLLAILSPEHDVRTNAEQQIAILEVTDEFGVHLTELTLEQKALLPVRQLASVLLRQYVESHWSVHSEKFRPPETIPEAKVAIRRLLPSGLQEPVSKVRSSVAYAIAAVAHWDWPEAWPDLFDLLMMNLMSENSFAVHGAMRALTEVSRDVTDSQMPQIAPVVLPQMLKIFTDAEKYSIRTRGRAVEIFITCSEVIAAMAEYNKSASRNLLLPILPQFTEALVKALIVSDGMVSDSGLKRDVVNALKILIRYFPKQIIQWLPHILTPVWNSLTESANLYIKTVVNDTEDAYNPVDSDGEVLGFENLIFSIFEFVSGLVESPKFRSYVQKGMSDLLYYVILYMQMTEEQVRLWSGDVDRFVEDEDEETFSYSVRISAQDLLLSLTQEFEDETAVSLCGAVTRHVQETNANSSSPHWWKIHESCMLALGSCENLILSQIENNNLQFDMLSFLQSVVLEDLTASLSPFLLGRCLWISSRFAAVMTEELLHRFLQATVSGLQQSQSPCVRVSAVRAIYGFCERLKGPSHKSLLVPYLAPMLDGVASLIVQYSAEVLVLALETLSVMLRVDDSFTAAIEARVTPTTIAVFLKYNSDPVLVTIVQDIFKQLCSIPSCQAPVQQKLLPTLVSALQAAPGKLSLGFQAVSLDLLQTLVRSSLQPLSDQLINKAFPAAVQCILHTDDNSILQSGGECLRAYVSVALDQVAAWHDSTGHSGLDYVVNVIELVLDPKTSETAAAFIGGLVSILVGKAGPSLGEKAEQLLRAVLSKMQQVESLSVTQSLVLIYAQLCRTQLEHVLEFLSGVPGPTGKSALEFVLVEWCQCHHMFFGSYETKVSAFSLSLILDYSIKSNDQRLQQIEVNGEPIINHLEGVKTRSKAAQNPDQWTRIPLLVKIYKILIQELSRSSDSCSQAVEDDSSDEEVDDNHENNIGDSNSLPAILTQDLYDLLDDDDTCQIEDDPDIVSDPICKENLNSYFVNFVQKMSQHPCYSSFSQHLTPTEKSTLASFGLL